MFKEPEYRQHEDFQTRTRKLHELKELGIDPYPPKFTPSLTAKDLAEKYAEDAVGTSEDAASGTTPSVTVAGRLVLFRPMGKNLFAQLLDGNVRVQVMCNRELTKLVGLNKAEESELSPLKVIEKKLDLGDFIGVEGHLFRTHRGELTVFAKKVTVLCKSLLPLPDKHAGLADKEIRYRKRWLDLLSNSEVYDTFSKRSRILALIRQFCADLDFLEIETPVLQNTYGGANAKPFLTEINALDKQSMFLRISLEIPLKQLIIGGYPRLFEIGKVFRNEGTDRNHNPEFTELEAYAAYWDYNDMMRFAENLFETIARDLYGSTKVPHTLPDGQEIEIEMKAPWKRMTMAESIRHYAKLDVDTLSEEDMRRILIEECHTDPKEVKGATKGAMTAMLFEEKVEPHLLQPHHITDHPIETTPLCKPHRDPKARAKGLVERFESYILSHEICNSYTELNDPELQRKLLLEQAKMREEGDEEAPPLDEEFIEAICQGMPPTGGIGFGVDRMVMIFTNSHSIRDVLFFPLMKPES